MRGFYIWKKFWRTIDTKIWTLSKKNVDAMNAISKICCEQFGQLHFDEDVLIKTRHDEPENLQGISSMVCREAWIKSATPNARKSALFAMS